MFKKTSQTTRNASGPPPAGNDAPGPDPFHQHRVKEHKRSSLSPAITLTGDISGEEDLVLDGKMDGSINLPKNELLIGPEGQVKANIVALKVSVEGRLTGDIKSAERVVIKHSGRVEGNIVAPRVVLEDGCQFKGSVEMNIDDQSRGASETKPRTTGYQDTGSQDLKGQNSNDLASKPKTGSPSSKSDQYASQSKSRASGAS